MSRPRVLPTLEVSEPFKAEIRGRERRCLEITCPYDDCGFAYIAEEKPWLKGSGRQPGSLIITAPCPYCFRMGYMPTAQGEVYRAEAEKRANA